MIEFDPTSPDETCSDRAELDLKAQGQFAVSGRASERGPWQTGHEQFNVLKRRPDQIGRDRQLELLLKFHGSIRVVSQRVGLPDDVDVQDQPMDPAPSPAESLARCPGNPCNDTGFH